MTKQEENELICEKLLKWQPSRMQSGRVKEWLDNPHGDDGTQWHTVVTPSFTTWAEVGLILEAFPRLGLSYDLSYTQAEDRKMQYGVIVWFPGKPYAVDADSLLVAIRAATLEHLRSLP